MTKNEFLGGTPGLDMPLEHAGRTLHVGEPGYTMP